MGRIFKREEMYCIDFTVNGKRYRKAISTKKKDAELALLKIESSNKLQGHKVLSSNDVLFIDLMKKFLSEHSVVNKKSSGLDMYLSKALVSYFGQYPIDQITPQIVSDYKVERIHSISQRTGRMISKSTINLELTLLKTAMNKAVEWGYLDVNPIVKTKLFKPMTRENILSMNELQKLTDSAPYPLKYFIMVAINTGMRRNEILKLEWRRIDLNNRLIYIEETKNGDPRTVPLNDELTSMFSSLKTQWDGSPYVFINPKTNRPYSELKTAWNTLKRKLNIKNLRFHDLRHNFATHSLSQGGGNLRDLSEMLGHRQLSTTMRYSHAQTESMRRLANAMNIKINNIDNPKP